MSNLDSVEANPCHCSSWSVTGANPNLPRHCSVLYSHKFEMHVRSMPSTMVLDNRTCNYRSCASCDEINVVNESFKSVG